MPPQNEYIWYSLFAASLLVWILLTYLHFLRTSMIKKKSETDKLSLISTLSERDEQMKQLLYEITVLKEIQENNQSRLNIEKVLEIIVQNLDSFISYSTVSSLIPQRDKLVIKTTIKELVNHDYINSTKDNMVRSFMEISDAPLPINIEMQIAGTEAADFFQYPHSSFFHIPLFVNGKAVALLTVSSTKKDFYTLNEMLLLYRVIELAAHSLSSLEMVMTIERGKLMSMIGSLSDGLFMVDNNNQVTIINDAAKQFLHVLRDNPSLIDVLSALPQEFDFGHKIQHAIRHNDSVDEKEVAIGDKFFQITITPVQDLRPEAEQTVLGVSILLHDITLEKNLAKMKEDFTHVIVHELRSPLSSIKTTSQLLTSQAHLSEDEKSKLLYFIYIQSRKLLDEVSLILDAAKLEAGLFTIQKAPNDLKKVIQESAALFLPQAQEKTITVTTEIDPAITEFLFDMHHISHCITNLLSNSIKFTPIGGSIKVTAQKTIDTVTVSVSDTGTGIPKEKQHLLFSKFSQIASSKTQAGTGLGLYYIKGVIEAHGGKIKLESEEGQGTTITFTLPFEENTPLLTEEKQDAEGTATVVS